MFLRPSTLFRCMFSWGVPPWSVLPSLHTAACSAGMCSPRYGCVQGVARELCGRAEGRLSHTGLGRIAIRRVLALLTLLESVVRQTIIGNSHSAALHTYRIKIYTLHQTEIAGLHRSQSALQGAEHKGGGACRHLFSLRCGPYHQWSGITPMALIA